VGAIPVELRTLVPLAANGGSFSGILTGGNGRQSGLGQTLTYAFDVPAGQHDLSLGLALADSNYNLEGVLVDPNGNPIDVQTDWTALDPNTGQPIAFRNTMQFFRRDPQAGRWRFILSNNTISGAQTALPFSATIALNAVQVSASGVPAGQTLTAGQPQTVTITVTNTGNTPKDFFVDPRLITSTALSLGGFTANIPPQPGDAPLFFDVPTESSEVTIAAESNPTTPIDLDVAPGGSLTPVVVGSPELQGTPFLDSGTGNYASVADYTAPAGATTTPGLWFATPTQIGPYATPVTPVVGTVSGVAVTQEFDLAAVPSTGDGIGFFAGTTPEDYTPLTLDPGQTGTITVLITPQAGAGTVSGNLYVDALAVDANTQLPMTLIDDELVAIPYSYTVGA
jgi:hypothetical protein